MRALLNIWYSAKRAGVKRACPNKVVVHRWFMHDARLGHAFLFLHLLAEYTIAVNDSHGYSMSLVCSWNKVGDVLCQVSSSPFCTRPFWRMPKYTKKCTREREEAHGTENIINCRIFSLICRKFQSNSVRSKHTRI